MGRLPGRLPGGVVLAREAVVVGAALALAWWAVDSARVRWHPAATGFAVGAGLHLLFEVVGLNRAYCTAGHACMS